MPQCFQLFKKGTTDAVSLSKLDELICQEVLQVEVHPSKYGGDWTKSKNTFNWFDSIGFTIACNSEKSLGSEALRKHYSIEENVSKENNFYEEDLAFYTNANKVLDYLEANYSSTCFYEYSH